MKYRNKAHMLSILNKVFIDRRGLKQDTDTLNEILTCPVEDLDQILEKEIEILSNPPKETEKKDSAQMLRGLTFKKINDIIAGARRASIQLMPNLISGDKQRQSDTGTSFFYNIF